MGRQNVRGRGSVFQKKAWKSGTTGKQVADGKTWAIQYCKDDPATGKRVRVREGGFETKTEASQALTDRMSKVDRGEAFEPRAKHATKVADLFVALRERVETEKHGEGKRGERAVKGLDWRWAHLKESFGGLLAKNVTTPAVTQYTRKRQKEKAANATINRELAVLRRMFNFGRKECTPPLVHFSPYVPMLPENNVRQGFIEDADFDRMAAEAKELWLRAFLELAYTYGWRRGELIGLRVGQVNFSTHTIRLETGTTKNGEGREVRMTARVETLLRELVSGKGPKDAVFAREDGKPVKEFQATWEGLCVRTGLGSWTCSGCGDEIPGRRCACGGERRYKGLIVHDFRRSAAKALRRAGVPESVIMDTGAWKTASIFRRYCIVSAADQREAIELLELARARNRAETLKPLSGPYKQESDETTPRSANPKVM